jgi:type III pantothenate kinase
MLLAVDVGNTNTVVGVFDGDALRQDFRIESSRTRTSDEYGILLLDLFRARGLDPSAIDGAIVACVVPPLEGTVLSAIKGFFGATALVVGPGIKTGVPVLADNPREVGADRIVNSVAAHAAFGRAVIVVDFGTSTNFDCVSAKGEFLGGVIASGVGITSDALFRAAAKLPRVDLARPPSPLGRNTIHAIQSGLYFGYVALVDGLVDRLKVEMNEPDCAVVATGGIAPVIAPESRTIQTVDPHLTLRGLQILHARNTKGSK